MLVDALQTQPLLLIPIAIALLAAIALIRWVTLSPKGRNDFLNSPAPWWFKLLLSIIAPIYLAVQAISKDPEGCLWFILFWWVGLTPLDK